MEAAEDDFHIDDLDLLDLWDFYNDDSDDAETINAVIQGRLPGDLRDDTTH